MATDRMPRKHAVRGSEKKCREGMARKHRVKPRMVSKYGEQTWSQFKENITFLLQCFSTGYHLSIDIG